MPTKDTTVFEEVTGLGTLREIHEPVDKLRVQKIAGWIALALAPVLVAALWVVSGTVGVILFVAGLFTGLAGATLLVSGTGYSPRRVALYEGGIAIGSEKEPIWTAPWSEIIGIRSSVRSVKGTLYHHHTLTTADARRYTLTEGTSGIDEIVEEVNATIMPRVHGVTVQWIADGRTAHLGAIDLDASGVSFTGRHRSKPSLAWRDISGHTVSNGHLWFLSETVDGLSVLPGHGRGIGVPCGEVDNLPVVVAILDRATGPSTAT